MSEEDRAEIERLKEAMLRLVSENNLLIAMQVSMGAKQESLRKLVIESLIQLGIEGAGTQNLDAMLKQWDREACQNILASVADHSPGWATELKKILDRASQE